ERFRCECRQLSAGTYEHVRRQCARAARISYNGQERAARSWLFAEHFRGVEQLFNVILTQYAHAPKGRVNDSIAARERTRVRSSRLRCRISVPDFDNHDWFAKRYFACRG